MEHQFNSNLFLTVQTDGDGTSCGYTYKGRCELAKSKSTYAKARRWIEMAIKADQTICKLDGEPATFQELLQCALELEAYYTEHVKEAA